jgi:plasmid stabilization system protein ParE
MSRFVVSAAARQDLRDIQSYIAADNVEAARKHGSRDLTRRL